MSDVRMAVAGASGRMGRTLIRTVVQTEGAVLSGALESVGHPDLGKDAGLLSGLCACGVALSDDTATVLDQCDVLIDFTRHDVSAKLSGLCATAHVAHIIGTTGFTAEEENTIAGAAAKTAILKSGNMSLGVSLLAALVEKAARALPGFDIEIVETHHNKKADAPSGTALMLGRAAAKGRGVALDDHMVRGRDGMTGPRKAGDIGFAALRGGTVVGEHQVLFAGPYERVTLSHSAEDRSIFASGAVRAGLWIFGKAPGLYAIADVLELGG